MNDEWPPFHVIGGITLLSRKYDPATAEPKWQRYWEERGLYRFDSQPDGPIYSIDTPPPTVSGDIHIGHVYSYTHAEMLARYWRSRGYRVFYPFGFDDNGLPTERLVEKEHGVKAANIGREEFVRLCLEVARGREDRFRGLWQRLGFSVDWTLMYSTVDQRCQRISQLSFLDVYKKGGIYQDTSPVAWCTECMTSVAQAELETDEVKSSFNYIVFSTDTGEELEIATTRPELIPACAAVFIHPDDARHYHLVGRQAIVPVIGRPVPILSDPAVDKSVGTGVVMCCTFGDQQDIEWWKDHRLELREMVGSDGRVQPGYGRFSGMKLSEVRPEILNDLREQGCLRGQKPILHIVACHERCGTPIEYRTSRQWFIRVMDRKDELMEAGKRINWHPEYMKHRYMQWVKDLEWDWCISRQRYLGVPFPLWYCGECGRVKLADMDQLPVDPIVTSPTGECECGSSRFVPERDVMDTWATSSVTPLINADWDGQEVKHPIVPASLRPQGHDIIRTWAFYTIVKSLYHTGDIPWHDVMVNGFVMAGRGEKLSKSKANAGQTPEELIDTYSADVVRLWASTGKLGTDVTFVEEEVANNQRVPVKLWNAARFVQSHLESFEPQIGSQWLKDKVTEAMDIWLLGRIYSTQDNVAASLESFEIHHARAALDAFFWNDFCDNYLEIVKERLYKPELRGLRSRESAQASLYVALLAVLRMYSVFAPHITEEIYQDFYKPWEGLESIHLVGWKQRPRVEISDETRRGGDEFLKALGLVRKWKSEHGLSPGATVRRIVVRCPESGLQFMQAASLDLKAVTRALNLELVQTEIGDARGSGDLEVEVHA